MWRVRDDAGCVKMVCIDCTRVEHHYPNTIHYPHTIHYLHTIHYPHTTESLYSHTPRYTTSNVCIHTLRAHQSCQ